MTPIELAERIEQAGPDDQRELLELAWRKLRGDEYVRTGINLFYVFQELLDVEAYLSAAEMLVPDGLVFSVMTDFDRPGKARVWGSVLPGQVLDRGWSAEASTPALALAAACLRAIAEDANQ